MDCFLFKLASFQTFCLTTFLSDLNTQKYRLFCSLRDNSQSSIVIRELANLRLSHDDAIELRDRLSAHAYLGTCRNRAKVNAVVDSDSPAS